MFELRQIDELGRVHDTIPSEILKQAISEMAVYAAESEYETEFYEIMDEVAKLMNECEEIENRG